MIVNVKRLTIIQVLPCAIIKIREGSYPKRHGGFQREHLSVTYPLQQADTLRRPRGRSFVAGTNPKGPEEEEGSFPLIKVKVIITPIINHAQ